MRLLSAIKTELLLKQIYLELERHRAFPTGHSLNRDVMQTPVQTHITLRQRTHPVGGVFWIRGMGCNRRAGFSTRLEVLA
jgi:hypothetical protein